MRREDRTPLPDRKISETFLDFAGPLIEAAGGEATKDQIEQILKIAFTVWNSVVLDVVDHDGHHVTRLKQCFAGDALSTVLVEQMIARKKATFNDDLRLIGYYGIMKKHGEYYLQAEARAPVIKGSIC